jgi:hypothetical protein
MTFYLKCTRTGRKLALAAAVALFGTTVANAQLLELRHAFERFEDFKIVVGGNLQGPINSELDPVSARVNVPFDAAADFDGAISLDYWQLRAGVVINMPSAVSPFLFWNPVIGKDFGGESSRWSASVGWEGIFSSVKGRDFDPRKQLQADNSIYTSRNSFSALVGYWFGTESGTSLTIDTNYAGRGYVDTNNFRTPPLDTNGYVRGILVPSEVPGNGKSMRYSSRNGFSAAFGFGTGKYAGSGPISKYLNFLFPSASDTTSSLYTNELLPLGLNPMAAVRYRYDDFIGQADVAGEDVNLAVIYRGVKDFDFTLGAKYLEHLFSLPSRGPNRTQFGLEVRYAPPLEPTYDRFETGDQVYNPSSDTDGDGIPDGLETAITHTDPTKADTDGDGVPDGVEVYSIKSNPVNPDSDGDGLNDGQEVNAQRRTDPLRQDTDEDGISDGAEVQKGSDPLLPGGGFRGR